MPIIRQGQHEDCNNDFDRDRMRCQKFEKGQHDFFVRCVVFSLVFNTGIAW